MHVRPSLNPAQFHFRHTLGTRPESYFSTHTQLAFLSTHTYDGGRVLTGYESLILEGHARLAAAASGSVTCWRL